MIPTEQQLQIYSADVFAAFGFPDVIGFHVPNERKGTASHYINMKRMGVRAGVSDWVFLLPDGWACVELKTVKGRQSPAQRQFQRDVEAIGGRYFIARSPEEIDGVFSALGIINKPVSLPGRGRAGGGTAAQAIGLPSRKDSKVAA